MAENVSVTLTLISHYFRFILLCVKRSIKLENV